MIEKSIVTYFNGVAWTDIKWSDRIDWAFIYRLPTYRKLVALGFKLEIDPVPSQIARLVLTKGQLKSIDSENTKLNNFRKNPDDFECLVYNMSITDLITRREEFLHSSYKRINPVGCAIPYAPIQRLGWKTSYMIKSLRLCYEDIGNAVESLNRKGILMHLDNEPEIESSQTNTIISQEIQDLW